MLLNSVEGNIDRKMLVGVGIWEDDRIQRSEVDALYAEDCNKTKLEI